MIIEIPIAWLPVLLMLLIALQSYVLWLAFTMGREVEEHKWQMTLRAVKEADRRGREAR